MKYSYRLILRSRDDNAKQSFSIVALISRQDPFCSSKRLVVAIVQGLITQILCEIVRVKMYYSRAKEFDGQRSSNSDDQSTHEGEQVLLRLLDDLSSALKDMDDSLWNSFMNKVQSTFPDLVMC